MSADSWGISDKGMYLAWPAGPNTPKQAEEEKAAALTPFDFINAFAKLWEQYRAKEMPCRLPDPAEAPVLHNPGPTCSSLKASEALLSLSNALVFFCPSCSQTTLTSVQSSPVTSATRSYHPQYFLMPLTSGTTVSKNCIEVEHPQQTWAVMFTNDINNDFKKAFASCTTLLQTATEDNVEWHDPWNPGQPCKFPPI